MSRMFDELNRAERERRRVAEEGEATVRRVDVASPEAPASPGRPPRVQQPPDVPRALPSEFARELGILRNSLEGLFAGVPKRSILFSSSVSGEGTTTIATSFARFIAMQGEENILICEMNARRPAFKHVFSSNGNAGVTEYFASKPDLGGLVQTIEDGRIDVLHAGQQGPDVVHIHLREAMPRLLREASQRYDTVILDAPPLVECPETPPMAGLVDGVVLVVQAGKTRREVVERAVESVQGFDGKILGIVLNRKKYYIPDFLYKRI